jgi:hypothetical protein
MDNIKVLLLPDGSKIISNIEEVTSELGEPDCKMKSPFLLKSYSEGIGHELEPWLMDETMQDEFMIHSDKILTIIDPKPTLLEKYQTLIK